MIIDIIGREPPLNQRCHRCLLHCFQQASPSKMCQWRIILDHKMNKKHVATQICFFAACGVFHKWVFPHGWMVCRENPSWKGMMGVPLFQETPMLQHRTVFAFWKHFPWHPFFGSTSFGMATRFMAQCCMELCWAMNPITSKMYPIVGSSCCSEKNTVHSIHKLTRENWESMKQIFICIRLIFTNRMWTKMLEVLKCLCVQS